LFAADPERVEMAGTLISPIEHPSEAFECLDCFLVHTLNEHGRCPRCGSNAVIQFMMLEKIGRWIKVGDTRYWVSSELTDINVGDSTARVSEQQHSRDNAGNNAPKLTGDQ
jgi:hypothetical protein